ncbi:hypothetical protein CSUB01_06164 [Colletotrichum sublineola]|uniref:Uncharacterized protein n=1 Tax=Colletotrichum sublineola TaxID=1173701 RepID=A0A066X5G0_COLSU|nr:hypothetical protein CSUB01_06164 [Colletotrichum sublineola]
MNRCGIIHFTVRQKRKSSPKIISKAKQQQQQLLLLLQKSLSSVRRSQDEKGGMETVNQYQRDSRQVHPSSSGRNPLRTVWRETYEVWDGVCYGVGKAYSKIKGKW